MSLKDLVLGTVQFGMNYGIHNLTGQPKIEDVYSILDYAYHHQICTLDTAADYCESESVIGDYINSTKHEFQVCTKLSSKIGIQTCNKIDIVEKETLQSLKRLHIDHAYVIYLHRFEQCKEADLIFALENLKKRHLTTKIGISIYEPKELQYIISALNGIIDVVQIPFNFFNCSAWLNSGLLEIARDKSINIYARSLYVQGLIFMNPEDKFVIRIGAQKYLEFFNSICKRKNMKPAELALGFVNSIQYLDAILIGCETQKQLKENITIYRKQKSIPQEEIIEIINFCGDIAPEAIDPRLWVRN